MSLVNFKELRELPDEKVVEGFNNVASRSS